MRICCGKQVGEGGLPAIGATARKLGARPEKDIELGVRDRGDLVQPGKGGMSVSPPPPTNISKSFRPPEYGGTGKDPVWEMDTDDLPRGLRYRPDPKRPDKHGFIEPSFEMPFETYQDLIHATRSLWIQV